MFDHYIGLDWAQKNMAIARMTRHSDKIISTDVPSSVKELKIYLDRLQGTKILTFEETSPAQWLYTELKDHVDEILVCDPYRNHLLKEGGKNDRVDAERLVKLLRAGMLKPVFHCTSEFINIRKIMSGFTDLVQMGVRLQNQRSALLRSKGLTDGDAMEDAHEAFVLKGLDGGVEFYNEQRNAYKKEFRKIYKAHKVVRDLESVPGIGVIGAITLASVVVDARRFKSAGSFLSYCGLVKHDIMSGGRSYGKRTPRHCRKLKTVFKTAAMSCALRGTDENPFTQYYQHLITQAGYAPYLARHALARRIAVVCLGVMKSGKGFNKKQLGELTKQKNK